MNEDFEIALAREGDTQSEDHLLAWEEKLALAPSLEAKKALIHGVFGVTARDFEYRSALCTLLEVQELLDDNTQVANAKAAGLLRSKAEELDKSVKELGNTGLSKKAKRISHRRRLLELELATRMNKSKEDVVTKSRALATEMGLTLSDSAPVDVAEEKPADSSTKIKEDATSAQVRVADALRYIALFDDKHAVRRHTQSKLNTMDVFARELFFANVLSSNSPSKASKLLKRLFSKSSDVAAAIPTLSSDQRGWILDMFLDEYAFEYAEVDGYLDLIGEDMEKKRRDGETFGFRQVHQKLAITHLESLLQRDSALSRTFGNDEAFALRYTVLMRSAIREEASTELFDHDNIKLKVAQSDRLLVALGSFTKRANTIRGTILLDQVRDLMYSGDIETLKQKFFQYIAIPKFGRHYTDRSFFSSVSADELIAFVDALYHEGTSPSVSLWVDHVSKLLCDKPLRSSDDEALIKATMYELWAGGHMSDSDEKTLHKHLSTTFIGEQKAECMVMSGRGDLAVWKAKLPRGGAELADWSWKTEISFCSANPTQFGPDDELTVYVRTRNVRVLSVQVYEVRTVDYYSRNRAEIQGDIKLDGLLPNEEQQIDLSHLAPWQKARVPVKLAPSAMGRRGVFVVEVFEKDTTCRAILRKGHLRHVEKVTARGHEITVLDEQGAVVPDASLMLMNLKSGASRAQSPRTYEPVDATRGMIVVPFRELGESSDKFAVILRHGQFGSLVRPFNYIEAAYTMDTQLYIDNEQLRPGEEAKLLVRPMLTVGSDSTHVSVDLLTEMKASIRFTSVNKESSAGVSQTTVLSLSPSDLVCTFTIPLDAEALSVEVSARIKDASSTPSSTETSAARGRPLPSVKSSKSFTVQRVTQFEATYSPLFSRRRVGNSTHFEYIISVLGHNGEPIAGKEMDIRLNELHFNDGSSYRLQSDEKGEINLGELEFVTYIQASFASAYPGGNSWSWEMPNLRTHTPQMINCALSENVRVPLPLAYSTYMEEWLAAGMVSVCRVYNLAAGEDPVIEDVTFKSRFQLQKNPNGDVVSALFTPHQIGKFVLYIRPLDIKYPVTVCRRLKSSPTSPPSSNQLLFDHKKILVATQTRPIMILGCSLDVQDEKIYLHVQTDGANSKNTQVWIVAKRFLDLQGHKMNQVVTTDRPMDRYLFLGQLAFDESSLENEFLKKRKISDEYTYILQRRAFIKSNPDSLRLLGGSSLPKPTFIQSPHVVDSSDMEELVMREGEKVSGFKTAEQRERASSLRQMATKNSRLRANPERGGGGGLFGSAAVVRNSSGIGFLSGVSAASSCGPLSADGIATLCLSDHPVFANAFAGSLELVIVAFDLEMGNVTSLETQITPNGSMTSTIKRDTRLSTDEALENATPSMQIQRHQVVKAGESSTLARTFSSKYALYESLSGAMDLWATLCSESSLPELVEKLKRWPEMKKVEKAAFYLKNASDDLNFFLYRKDSTFFNKFVKQLLQAKLSKSLIDLYVLEDSGAIKARYLSLGILDKLSLIEKLLVAERAGSAEETGAVCHHVIDSIDGECHSNSALGHQLARVFDTVLSQGAVKPQEPVARDGELTVLYGVVEEEEEEEAAVAYSGASLLSERRKLIASVQERSAPLMMMRSSAPALPPPDGFSFGSAAPEMTPISRSLAAQKKVRATMSTLSASSSRELDDDDDEASDSESDRDVEDAFSESSDDYGVESLDDDSGDNEDEDDNVSDAKEQESLAKQQRKRAAVKRRAQPYILPGQVRHIQEKRFFTEQKPHLDGCNMFWRDYALHLMQRCDSVERVPFISSYFPEALRSFTEGVLALSVLDLAYGDVTPTPVRQIAGGLRVRLDPESDVVLYHQGIGAGAFTKEPNSVLILKQRLLLESERTGGDFVDLRPAREFVVNRIYACVVSVSNIGSKRLTNLSLLRQIPRGAIPVTSTGFYTKSEQVEIAPHSTKSFVVNFYFPEPGQFTQYPAHASLDGEVVASATMDTQYTDPIAVVAKSMAVDLTSWNDVAARGSLTDVLTFMASAKNVRSLSLDALAWRCSDQSFYEGLIAYLRRRYVILERIWKYAFVHGDIVGMRELCASKSTFTCALGSGVRTSIVTVNDLFRYERFERSVNFDHTEFGPLLTRRVHRVAGRTESSSVYGRGTVVSTGSTTEDEPARVLNKKTREYYRTLCHVLSQRSSATSEQLLVMAYFLILFHRLADALVVFDRAKALRASECRDASTDELSIAVDYMDAYLDFFRSQTAATNESQPFAIARQLAAKHLETMSDRWRERFVRVQEVLDEHDDLHAQRSPAQTTTIPTASGACRKHVPDDEEVRLEAEVKGDEIHVKSQHLGACEISFYRIDVELMFSSEPFDSFSDSAASRSSLLLIEPWKVIQFPLAADVSMEEGGVATGPTMSTSVFKLPLELASSPMMIRIREVVATRTMETVASPIDLTRSYFNSQLQVIVSKQAGTVQVLHDGLPVPASYVKVYAKASGRQPAKKTQFYKDGYTDVLGKFDYAAINGDLLSRVEKFSVLVSHPTLGTSVVQTAPPVLAVTSSEFKDREAREALWF